MLQLMKSGLTHFRNFLIPLKKPIRQDIPFTPSDKAKGQKCTSNPLIRQIDGASFYELVTGIPNSLEHLYDTLPDVIAAITNNDILDRQQLKGLFKIAYG